MLSYTQALSEVSFKPSLFFIQKGKYDIRMVESSAELDAVLSLRYQVFNLELEEGLASSVSIQRDFDRYDPVCDHIIVIDREINQIVGTYRIQTYEMAQTHFGFYSANEFSFDRFPKDDLMLSVEIGRACIDKSYRNGRVLFLIWNGIFEYVTYYKKRFIFGCSSISSQSKDVAISAMAYLLQSDYVDFNHPVDPLPAFQFISQEEVDAAPSETAKIPSLFKIYLEFGAKICGLPAIDREFQTIDFLTLVTTQHIDSSMESLVDAKQKLK